MTSTTYDIIPRDSAYKMPYNFSYRRVHRKREVKMEVQNQEILGDRLFAIGNYKGAIERFNKVSPF